MMEICLALAKEGKLDESNGIFIFQALFRPTTTRLVKENMILASMLDLAMRMTQDSKKP
ncbi:MAG: hypothetical protein M2R45_03157 [Verrucomicrobia subdivision 3 bacterium]|nr:hypothetical protein [Limisphaerales bacterium]MCS1413224.1 hypothetical protein [Limisphaerales bacterium]